MYLTFRHQLERPFRYGQLKAFWEDKKGTLTPSGDPENNMIVSSSSSSDDIAVELKVQVNF